MSALKAALAELPVEAAAAGALVELLDGLRAPDQLTDDSVTEIQRALQQHAGSADA